MDQNGNRWGGEAARPCGFDLNAGASPANPLVAVHATMPLPDESPRLPKLPFLVAAGVLIVTALVIASRSDTPLGTTPVLTIVICVALSAALVAIPFLAEYARQQDLALAERQRTIEALARTTADTAEQISIAANGLHTIAGQAQENLRSAAQLPQQLQEIITTAQKRIAEAGAAAQENLRQQTKSLRTAEAGALEASELQAQQQREQIAGYLLRLEHLQESHAALEQRVCAAWAVGHEVLRQEMKLLLAADTGKWETAVENMTTAIADLARQKTVQPVQDKVKLKTPVATAPVVSASAVVIASADEKSAPETTSPGVTSIPAEPMPESAMAETSQPAKASAPVTQPAPTISPEELAVAVAAAVAAADALVHAVTPEETALTSPPFSFAPQPPRVAGVTAASAADVVAAAAPAAKEPTPKRKRAKAAENAGSGEKAPLSVATFSVGEVGFGLHLDSSAKVVGTTIAAPPEPPAPVVQAAAETAPTVADPGYTNSPMLELGLSDDTPLSPNASFINESFPTRMPFANPKNKSAAPGTGEESSVASADGVTRLLATAYIGIGNKLFLRGEGAGLSWDKGVPLQFVSIGKWRWETTGVVEPVSIKLYKNDQQECAALGTVTLQPGRQHEITADF